MDGTVVAAPTPFFNLECQRAVTHLKGLFKDGICNALKAFTKVNCKGLANNGKASPTNGKITWLIKKLTIMAHRPQPKNSSGRSINHTS
jgi:hypothetical protein